MRQEWKDAAQKRSRLEQEIRDSSATPAQKRNMLHTLSRSNGKHSKTGWSAHLGGRQVITLSPEDAARLAEMPADPPPPTEALRRAMEMRERLLSEEDEHG